MAGIKQGIKAPDFTLNDASGKKVRLSDFKGKKVILYFYPKDNTPGCTQEACDFRDTKKKFDRADTVILGVSPDSEKSHIQFADKFNLPFVLLSDPERKVADTYGVFKEKMMYGKTVKGIERSTFLIDESGILIKEMRKVKVKGHVEEVLSLLQG